jgi:hypothetical protein
MYWRVPVVILCLMVSQAIGDNGEYVYVISKRIECISNPVNDICPVTHKVPDRIQNLPWINRTMINTTLSSTSTLLRTAGGNESCIDTTKMFQCSQFLYTCKDNDDYVYLDSSRIYQLCNDARQKCMNIDQGLQDRLFNCTLYTTSTRYSKGSKCKEYQKVENDTCPMPDYKVSIAIISILCVFSVAQTERRWRESFYISLRGSYHALHINWICIYTLESSAWWK